VTTNTIKNVKSLVSGKVMGRYLYVLKNYIKYDAAAARIATIQKKCSIQ